MAVTYKDAGVDVERGYEAVRLMKEHVKKTFDENVITDLGTFGGMYDLNNGQVLVSGTDGVGTKLMAAFATGKNDTVGIDCVAMCANDVVCHGARPLFFLDYIATGALVPGVAADIVKGIADGCMQSGCALIGGETAEMPGFYPEGEYDLAGFCVGIVNKDAIINGSGITPGDKVIGLGSTGIHSNGFSLVRKLYAMDPTLNQIHIEETGTSLGEMLLTPTRIYVKSILDLIGQVDVKGIAHITGGGFYENIPRILPKNVDAKITLGSWDMPYVFEKLIQDAQLSQKDAYNTFNMGVGMVVVVSADQAEKTMEALKASGERAYLIGEITEGSGGVELC
ncbi:phosphoribosylformylglycinamidine cyclo-ligase [Christensenella timonensis]|uniref:phosphoribosylformylglycinamidine cyclo-ligase n=1 Tax=Christensenella timonensis TaxID=1816678 RepID=UPI00082E0969|nr:phosphoribosylformylglycinamidine cyclo-ligase [Christensenella timonensis]